MKSLSYKRIKDLAERHDSNGERIPFSIRYACLNGAIVDIQDREVICIGVDLRHRRRTIKHRVSGEIRTIHDCLILRIDDTNIVVK